MTASVDSQAAAAQSQTQQRIPDFFIVGHAKCGTTALYEMLKRHPQIYMPAVKEPQFFARNSPPPSGQRRSKLEQTGRREMTLDDYLSLFAAAEPHQRIGEASTFYLWAASAPARIAQAQPAARIIAILREPAAFLRSVHLQLLQNHQEVEKDLRTAISLDEARREGRKIPSYSYWPRALIYSDRVRYVEQLQRYHAVFPPDQVLVVIYDDFRRDNEATVHRVLRFLDVDETYPVGVVEANPTMGVRSVRLDSFMRTVRTGRGPVSGAVKMVVKGITPWKLRHHLLYPMRHRIVYAHPKPPDEDFMLELRRRFKPEVVALSEYLRRDLVKLWGYEHLG
jgi:hypothetical protein